MTPQQGRGLVELDDNGSEVFSTCDFCVVAFSALIFHAPNITGTDGPFLTVASSHFDKTRQADQHLRFGRGMDRFVPTRRQTQKQHRLGGFGIRDFYCLGRWCEALFAQANIHRAPVTFTIITGEQVVVLHDNSPDTFCR